jgi:cell wall-associated NlpC family hydrolase
MFKNVQTRWPRTIFATAATLTILAGLEGCGTVPLSGNALGSRGSDANQAAIPARLSADQANDVTIYAISLVGTPYRYGGNTPDSGFDCSGLISYVYKSRANLPSPRTVASLVNWGQPVPGSMVRTGDLVVFLKRGVATHAGIYVGEGRFVHAPSTGGEVKLDTLTSVYWSKQPFSFRRP